MMRFGPKSLGAAAFLATALLSPPRVGYAQVLEGFTLFTHAGVGYVVNAPSQLNGIGGFVLGPRLRNWGVYLDAKRTHESRRDEAGFVDNIRFTCVSSRRR